MYTWHKQDKNIPKDLHTHIQSRKFSILLPLFHRKVLFLFNFILLRFSDFPHDNRDKDEARRCNKSRKGKEWKSIAGKNLQKQKKTRLPFTLLFLYTSSSLRLLPLSVHIQHGKSLVGLNIIYSTNIDFSWIEKYKKDFFWEIRAYKKTMRREKNSINLIEGEKVRWWRL
jgi:hypothetical protein